MKILLIGPFPPPIEGCSNSNRVLYKNLVQKYSNCDYINTNTNILSGSQGTSFSLKKCLLFLRNYLFIYKILFSDVIYMTPGQTFYGVLKYAPFVITCILSRKRFAIHVHGNFLGLHFRSLTGIKRIIFYFLISKASVGIVITKSLSKNFDGLLDKKKVVVVEYFVEDEFYRSFAVKKTDKLRIIYLSNLMREKGVLEFLDALIDLQLSNIDFNATIVGSVELGLKVEIDNKLKLLSGNVIYMGILQGQEKIDQLVEANVFILPTYYTMEGLPFSILEAMATGNIIITTNHAGISDVINDLNGFIVNKRSFMEISKCLKNINLDISGNVMKYSEYNKKYSLMNFTEKKFTEKIITILHECATA